MWKLPKKNVSFEDKVIIEKECSDHGVFKEDIWRGEDFLEWLGDWRPGMGDHPSCPDDCGLCKKHLNRTCCTIFEITERCDLSCNFCFAESGNGNDMPFEEAAKAIDDIYDNGSGYIHLSGGEPLLHPKIIEIISYAKEKGFEYIQLNTNGMKIAEKEGLAEELKTAGVSSVFLSFDGTERTIYEKICGKDILDKKLKVIEKCNEAELGVVLVPRLIKGINDHNIGKLIRFAYDNIPAVRGVHIQPVTYVGRFTKEENKCFECKKEESLVSEYHAGQHLTLPEVLESIEEQSEGLIKKDDFLPSSCDAPLCGFHAEYIRTEEGLKRLKKIQTSCCGPVTDNCCGSDEEKTSCCDPEPAQISCCAPMAEKPNITLQRKLKVSRSQLHVKSRWTRAASGNFEKGSLSDISKKISDQSFFVSGMLFQDLYNIDLARCRCCSLNVYEHGRFMPFCIRNIRFD